MNLETYPSIFTSSYKIPDFKMGKTTKTEVESVQQVIMAQSKGSSGINGILLIFPHSLRPYVEVTRFHKPAGLLGFCFPYLISIFFTASITSPLGTPSPSDVTRLTLICLLDSLLLRSFGCAWNDTIDRDVDRQVARSKGRPVARGAISPAQAVRLTLFLVLVRHITIGLVLPIEATYHALFVTAVAFLYPFGKRFTDFPQVILGVAVGWPVFLVNSVVNPGGGYGHHDFKAVTALFLALTLWNITYDTVYAFQDVEDDKKAGVKSMAVRFQDRAKVLLLCMIVIKTTLLFYAGSQAKSQVSYHTGAFCASAGAMILLVILDLGNPKSCQKFFVNGQYVVSGALLAGVVVEYFLTLGRNSKPEASFPGNYLSLGA